MIEIDKKKILDKLQIIQDTLSKLMTLSELSEDEFVEDFKNYDSAKYNFVKVIEAIIDISNHIIARRKLGIPKTFSDTFEILGKSGLISKDETESYKRMAKFRNRLVHFYQEVDDKEVYRILRNNLEDLERFVDFVKELVIKD